MSLFSNIGNSSIHLFLNSSKTFLMFQTNWNSAVLERLISVALSVNFFILKKKVGARKTSSLTTL